MNESTVKLEARATWTHDLSRSERRFVAAMNELGFGRFESLRIRGGELLLDPWPTTVRYVKLGAKSVASRKGFSGEFELECPLVELFEFVRANEQGEILRLEYRHGLPFVMEVTYRPDLSQAPDLGRR